MKLVLQLFVLWCLCISQLQGQRNIDLEFSSLIEEKEFKPLEVFPLKNNEYLLVKIKTIGKGLSKEERLSFVLLDEDMNPIEEYDSRICFKKSNSFLNPVFHSFGYSEHNLCVFTYCGEKGSYRTLCAYYFNPNSMSLSDDPIRVGKFEKQYKNDSGNIDMVYSAGKNWRVMSFLEKRPNKYSYDLELRVLGLYFREFWRTSVSKPKDERRWSYSQPLISNQREVYIIERWVAGTAYEANTLGADRGAILVKYNSKGERVKEQSIPFNGKKLSYFQNLGFDDNGHLRLFGFYSDQGVDGYLGTFFMQFNPETLELELSKMDAFSLDFKLHGETNYTTKQILKNEKKGLANGIKFKFKDKVFFPDGSIYLLAEYYEETKSSDPKLYEHRFNDIFVFKLNNEGDLLWSKKIFKKQYVYNEKSILNFKAGENMSTSFSYMATGDKLHFIFNDHLKNTGAEETKRDVKSLFDEDNSNFILLSMDQNGNTKRKILFETSVKELQIYPAFSKPLNTNRSGLILMGWWEEDYRLGQIKWR